MKRALLLLVIMGLVVPTVQAQYLMIDQSMHRTASSPGGAILKAPVLATDQEFWFPATGGTLVTEGSLSGWNLSGNALVGTEVLGSTNAFDVHLISGGTSNVRMTLLNSEAGVLLPAQTELRLGDAADGEYSALKSPATLPSSITYILPDMLPDSARQRLQVEDVTGNTVTIGYTTVEKSTDVSFDLVYADTDVNTAVAQDVTDMSITIEPYKTYAFEALVCVSWVDQTCNAVISFDLPADAEMWYYHVDINANNAVTEGGLNQDPHTYDAPQTPAENHFLLKGFVRTEANGGTLQMQMATSNDGRTIRLTHHSFMFVTTN